ncbi:MAG TPA: biosynthetic arginine decarboxylase [Blastocatellia bacterium]|nr:biosynthetic arginine decarboxylase [Blastocatellia bacterium]
MRTGLIEETEKIYGIENWGGGYFGVNKKGNLIVHPSENDPYSADVKEIIDNLVARKVKLPILLRFPQILDNQVRKMHTAFKNSIADFEYQGGHLAVFPMKVNQRREVIEEYLREGSKYNFGLESGSKAELYSALAFSQSSESLLVLNGFKDEPFIDLALLGTRIGKKVLIVVENLKELAIVVKKAHETGVRPMLGVRVKLYSKGAGKWEKSGGDVAKFGLTTAEMLEVIRILSENKMLDMLKLLHFHIGSQIPEIKRVKNAIKEAARVYCKVKKMNIDIEYLDVGGGMAVDYDGSKTSFESSANYNMQEFTNDVIYTIKSVCEDENIKEPIVVTESGRVLTAYHAILVANIIDEIETYPDDIVKFEVDEDDPLVVVELKDLSEHLNSKNYREYFHDALEHKEELFTLFNLGLISLEDRAKGEQLFWEICEKANKFAQAAKYISEEFDDLKKQLATKYLCNFSVFRSLPDHWAIDQLFPIMPIHKLNETPTEYATLADITCDSDGIIDKFIDLKDVKEVLEIHPFKSEDNEPYYVGFFLVGAYQEVMGNFHNLLGTVNEAHVVINDNGHLISKVIPGQSLGDILSMARYDRPFLQAGFRSNVEQQVKAGRIDQNVAEELINEYEATISSYTYLE